MPTASPKSSHWCLAPFAWDESRRSWSPPAGARVALDLRPIPAQGEAGFAFVAIPNAAGLSLGRSRHMGDAPATGSARDAWREATGYRPRGDSLVDLLWDQLTAGSDPSGENGPKPLVPGTDGLLHLHVAGRVRAERFRWGIHPHTARLKDLLQRDFREAWERSNGADHCRKALDFTCEKYRVDDWREFVPADLHAHVPGRLPHETTFTESFPTNAADLTAGGQDLTWGSFNSTGGAAGTFNVAGGRGGKSGGGSSQNHTAIAAHDLSGSDHYAEVANYYPASNSYHGPAARCASDGSALYAFVSDNGDGTGYLVKASGSGNVTTFAIGTFGARTSGLVTRCEANGSTITGYRAGASIVSVTDTSVTGTTRCGVNQFGAVQQTFDDFVASDLGAGGGGISIPVVIHHLRMQGMA